MGITPIDAADLTLDRSEVAKSVLPPKPVAEETNVSLLSESDSDTGTEVMFPVVNTKAGLETTAIDTANLETTTTETANLKLDRSGGEKPELPPEPCEKEINVRLPTESDFDTGSEVMSPVVNPKDELEMTAMDTANLKLDRSEGAKPELPLEACANEKKVRLPTESDSDSGTVVISHVAGKLHGT